jgi:hypothetical protein
VQCSHLEVSLIKLTGIKIHTSRAARHVRHRGAILVLTVIYLLMQ